MTNDTKLAGLFGVPDDTNERVDRSNMQDYSMFGKKRVNHENGRPKVEFTEDDEEYWEN